MSGESPDHWNVKVYEDGEERETIRGLTAIQKDTVLKVFKREGVEAHAMGYSSDGEFVSGSETVNRHDSQGSGAWLDSAVDNSPF